MRLTSSKFNIIYSDILTLISIWYLIFSGDILAMLSSFLTCRNIGEKNYMITDLEIFCDDSEMTLFKYLFSIPLLFAWVIIPLLLLLKLK